jgi:Excalibur calcium-binding domain
MTAPPTTPQPPNYPPPPTGQSYDYPPPRRSRRKWPWVVLGVVVLFIIGVANSPSPPSSTTVPVPTPQQTAQAVDPPAPPPVAPQPAAPQRNNDSDGGAVYYKNCNAARAAGAAPIKRGDPGYRPALDRDNDGTACGDK